jgi:hypothetical protein
MMSIVGEEMYGSIPEGMSADYVRALSITNPGATQIIADNQAPGEPWWQTGQKILLGLFQTDQQRQIMQLNLERARQGLPPVDPTQYSGLGVQVGLAPQTQNLILIGLIGLGAVLLLSRR